MKTFKSFTEEAKRNCPDDYEWSSKYKACVPKDKRWKNVGMRWGGHGHDRNHSGNGNGGGGNGGGGNGG